MHQARKEKDHWEKHEEIDLSLEAPHALDRNNRRELVSNLFFFFA